MPAARVVFDPFDAVDSRVAQQLTEELAAVGVEAQAEVAEAKGALDVGDIVTLVSVLTANAAALSVVVAFLHRTFESGVVVKTVDGDVEVRRDPALPLGSITFIPDDGVARFERNVTGTQLTSLVQSVLGSADGRGDEA